MQVLAIGTNGPAAGATTLQNGGLDLRCNVQAQQATHHPRDYDQWDAWDAIDVPTLCLRGETSDLLLPEVAEAMRARGPRAVVVTIPCCGHAPALNVPDQFALVERFFNGR